MVGNKFPRTSVIVPARNADDTLATTLDSLRSQSDPDWEAILVDDASTDQTADIINYYVRQDRRFTGVRGNGAGVAAARNTGLAVARGERLVFLDSDDWLDRCFLELMNGVLSDDDTSVAVYCGYHRVFPDGTLAESECDPSIAMHPGAAFARSCATAIHAVLIRRAAVSAVGGFDTSLQTCEDWDLWQRVALQGGGWRRLERALSFYRVRVDSLSRNCRQLLADAAIVIQRGFSALERRLADGTLQSSAATTAGEAAAGLAYTHFALWCVGLDCGGGGTGADGLRVLGRTPPEPIHTDSLAGAIFSGLTVGLPALPRKIAARWPDFGEQLAVFFSRLGTVWDDRAAARRLLYQVERIVLFFDDLAQPRRLALTYGLRMSLYDLQPVTPPPSVDRLVAKIHDRRGNCCHMVMGVLGTVTVQDWLRMVAVHLGGWQMLRAVAAAVARSSQVLIKIAGPRRPVVGHRAMVQRLLQAADQALIDVRRTTMSQQARKHEAGMTPSGGSITPGKCRALPVLLYELNRLQDPSVRELVQCQLEWLCRHGYHGIASGNLLAHLRRRTPFAERRMMICFAGTMSTFISHGWPTVRQFGFRTTLFLDVAVEGRRLLESHTVNGGGKAVATTIECLLNQGVSIGILAGGRDGVDGLSTTTLVQNLAMGRALLSRWSSRQVFSYGVVGSRRDERLARLAGDCGYHLGFCLSNRPAMLGDDLLEVPCLAAYAYPLDAFVHTFEKTCQ